MIDGLGGLFSGTSALALVAYGAVNVFATGPMVAARMIEVKENWAQVCRAEIAGHAARSANAGNDMAARTAAAMAGCRMLPPGPMRQYCYRAIETTAASVTAQAEHQKRQVMSFAIARADTRCGCAKAHVQAKHAGSFAIYTGSLRVVTPPAVQNLTSELKTALHSRACAMKG